MGPVDWLLMLTWFALIAYAQTPHAERMARKAQSEWERRRQADIAAVKLPTRTPKKWERK